MTDPRVALISCSVFDHELAMLAEQVRPPVLEVRLEIGLHDTPDLLRARLQEEIGRLEQQAFPFDVIVLAYGVCGRGADGLKAGKHPLVIARAHDCFTHLLGSKEAHAKRQAEHPDTYYYSPGWNQARRVPGPERLVSLREQWSERFDPEDVDFLIETEESLWKQRSLGVFVDLGTAIGPVEAAYARRCCEGLGWQFEQVRGDPTLLRDLLQGPWDEERFQVVRPGATLRFTGNEAVFREDSGA